MSGAAIQINYTIPNRTLVDLYVYYSTHYFMFCGLDEKKIIDSFIIGGIRDLLNNEIFPDEKWLQDFDLDGQELSQHHDYLILMDEARHIWNSYYGKCQNIIYNFIDNDDFSEQRLEHLLPQWIIRKAISYFMRSRTYGGENLIEINLNENLVKKIVQNLPTVDADYLMNIEQYIEYLVDKDILERKNDSE